jgi:iron-sulfur cluster insertion protein
MLQAQATTSSAPASMPQFQRTIAEKDLRVTPAARAKMSELLADEEDVNAIRVFVSGGGCGGMTYGMTFTDSSTEFDCVIEEDGFALYIDTVALNFMRGVEIDFVERPTGASFVFNNAFAATSTGGSCGGCGSAGGGGGGCA